MTCQGLFLELLTTTSVPFDLVDTLTRVLVMLASKKLLFVKSIGNVTFNCSSLFVIFVIELICGKFSTQLICF